MIYRFNFNLFQLFKKLSVKIIFIVVLISILAGIFYSYWGSRFRGGKEKEVEQSLNVNSYKIISKKCDLKIKAIGTISFKEKASITPKIDGKLEKIYVEKGDHVKKDQLLALFDQVDIDLQLKSMNNELTAAQANLSLSREKLRKASDAVELHLKTIKKAELDVRDKKIIYKNIEANLNRKAIINKAGGIADVQIEELVGSYKQAYNQYLSAKKDLEISSFGYQKEDIEKYKASNPGTKKSDLEILKLLNTRLEQEEVNSVEASMQKLYTEIEILETVKQSTYIKSPISGVVAQRAVEFGERVNKEKEIFTIMNISSVYLVIFINENDISRLKNNMPVNVTVDAIKDKKFAGKIFLISPLIDPSTRTIEIKIEIDNSTEILKPGMFARSEIITKEIEKAIILPELAVKDSSDGKAKVFLVKENTVFNKEIEIGEKIDEGFIVNSGLVDGDEVVISHLTLLKEGMKVKCTPKEFSSTQ